MALNACVKLVTEGFDECIKKLPTIASVLAKVPYRHNELHMSLPLESLNSLLRTARSAVIRYHLSTTSPSPEAATSLGGLLWRVLKSSDQENKSEFCKGWRSFSRRWFDSSFGRDRVPHTTELESAVFFAAAVVPLVMQVFESEELALFANGSTDRIPNVWPRIVEWDCKLIQHDQAVKKSKHFWIWMPLWIRCFCCCRLGVCSVDFRSQALTLLQSFGL
jgi:hypothetical protein